MKVRFKSRARLDHEVFSDSFNTHGLGEVIVQGDWGADSCYVSSLDVFLEKKQEWKDLRQAFIDRDLITDNYNTIFFEPKTDEDRARGYTL